MSEESIPLLHDEESDGEDVVMNLGLSPKARAQAERYEARALKKFQGKAKADAQVVSPLETLSELRKQIDAMAEMLDEIACESQKEEIERAKTPPPEIVFETVEMHEGTPVTVRKMLSEMGERRKQLEEMWKKEGRTTTYLPGSEQAKKMKMQARLECRRETRHAELIKKFVEKNQVPIAVEPGTEVHAVPIE